ncbi:MAG: hypothetical protein O2931_08060 [Planctomycetota bacterium]|nr:hypothetical protein [Planctomycetota bacterium]MDA1178735.1 hypothetical protein [Planctomycetota bacterium]
MNPQPGRNILVPTRVGGRLEIRQESVDVDVGQRVRLVGFVRCIERVARVGGLLPENQIFHLWWRMG